MTSPYTSGTEGERDKGAGNSYDNEVCDDNVDIRLGSKFTRSCTLSASVRTDLFGSREVIWST